MKSLGKRAAAVLKIVAEGSLRFVIGGFPPNGYGDLSSGHYNLPCCAIVETLLTFFVPVIMGATPAGGQSELSRRLLKLRLRNSALRTQLCSMLCQSV